MPVDVESELGRLGSAWSESIAHVDVAEVLERTMTTRSQPVDDMGDPPATGSRRGRSEPEWHRSGQRWLVAAACTALVAAGVVAVAQRQAGDREPVTNPVTTPSVPLDTAAPLPPPDPFVGVWVSTDTDGSTQAMNIAGSSTDEYEVVVRDDAATGACAGAAATMIGTGRLVTDLSLLIAQPVLTCDDGTVSALGPPPQAKIADFTFDRDPVADELTDRFGVVWRRPGSTRTGNTTLPTTSIEPAAAAGSVAERHAVVERLIDALNTAVIDDSDDFTSIRDLFTENATIRALPNREQRSLTEPLPLEQWILQLRNWGFDGVITDQDWGCFPSEDNVGTVLCSVRVRWATLLAEADETWEVEFVGDQIDTLLAPAWGGVERSEVTLPLAVGDLAFWEQWLRETDPATAARLVPTLELEYPVFTRYDSAVAAEITDSIQAYVENRPSGDEISVTADVVEVGDRLVPVTMARADDRRYVLAGRYQTGRDLEVAFAEQAVLAAFDDVGRELWRTELEGRPTKVAVVDNAVWVNSNPDSGSSVTLTRIASSDGRVLGDVTIDLPTSDMVGGFGSLWILERSGQLVRVNPDMSTTTVDGSFPDLTDGCDYCPEGPTVGSDAIWVPLVDLGVAVIDVVTNQVTTIPRDEIGHDVLKVAFDGEVTYVASSDQVTSIVDGQVRATVTVGEFWHLGLIDGVFGALLPDGQFAVLRANEPMVVERRQTSEGLIREIYGDGEAWGHVWNGRKPDFRRVVLLPVQEANG